MFHQAHPNSARPAGDDARVSPIHSLQPFNVMREKQVTRRHFTDSVLLTTLLSPAWQGMAMIV